MENYFLAFELHLKYWRVIFCIIPTHVNKCELHIKITCTHYIMGNCGLSIPIDVLLWCWSPCIDICSINCTYTFLEKYKHKYYKHWWEIYICMIKWTIIWDYLEIWKEFGIVSNMWMHFIALRRTYNEFFQMPYCSYSFLKLIVHYLSWVCVENGLLLVSSSHYVPLLIETYQLSALLWSSVSLLRTYVLSNSYKDL